MPTIETSRSDLEEARRYLPKGTTADHEAFAHRQICARSRLTRLLEFYGRYPCRMAWVHLLTSSCVTIARSCGFSDGFNALGEAIMLVDDGGRPRSDAWAKYQQACAAGTPWTVRDELWLEAHALDWQAMRAANLDAAFFAEARQHAADPNWQLLTRHLEMTLGARQFDEGTHSGREPYETAIALAMGLSVRRLFTRGGSVVRRYAWETLGALVRPACEPRRPIVSYRRCAFTVLWSLVRAWNARHVYRRGMRIKNRGVTGREVDWPLLETILGEQVKLVDPVIVRFYRNPGRFAASACLQIHTLPLLFYSRLAAMLLGQGLYEQGQPVIPARLRVFRRADESMHFVRELYCGEELRVFDSDFVIRTIDGKPTLVKVFGDLGVDVVLDVAPCPNGGVAVRGRDIYWRGLRLPRTALKIEFISQVMHKDQANETIEVVGRLDMAPRTALGRFLMYQVFRRPRQLGSITYWLCCEASSGITANR